MPSTDTHVPYSVAARDLLRNTLLDSASRALDDRRWAEVTMADVAFAAGVSRQTLYAALGSRGRLARALVVREVDVLLLAAQEAIEARSDDLPRALAAAFELFVRAAEENPVVRAIARGAGAEELREPIVAGEEPLFERVIERLTQVILRTWPAVGIADGRLLGEWLTRLGVSYAVCPRDPQGMSAAALAKLLAPFVERLLSIDSIRFGR
jgi:AcrR family transcriptional regulator